MGLLKKKQPSICTAIIVAAGNATRMGGIDKIFAAVNGKPLLAYSLQAFQDCPMVSHIVVVTRVGTLTHAVDIINQYGITKAIKVTSGGKSRLQSVANGLSFVPKNTKLIAIHDGARPLVSQNLICDAVRLAEEKSASEPGIPVKDTVKVVENGVVSDTPDRKKLFAVQTPQVFREDLIRCAIQNAIEKNLPVTDDAMAVEAIGGIVWISKGEYRNMKVTTPEDLQLVEALIKEGNSTV